MARAALGFVLGCIFFTVAFILASILCVMFNWPIVIAVVMALLIGTTGFLLPLK